MEEKITRIRKGKMKRVLGVLDLFAIGFGDLGSSIYYALGVTALYALGATPLAMMTAGFVFMCTALSYAEMSSVVHEAGGSASFSRKAFNDLISFIAGWGLLLDYIVTIAISAFSVPPYLSFFISAFNTTWVQIVAVCILIGILMALNVQGTKQSTRFSIILTLLALLTQGIIIFLGFIQYFPFKDMWSHLAIGGSNTFWSPSSDLFWKGVVMAMVAYTGIESMAQLAEESRDPEKTVPKAMMITMVVLLLLYLTLSVVSMSALSPQSLSTTYLENPIAGVASTLPFGRTLLGGWISVFSSVILIVAANAGLIGASRLMFNMGEYFQVPKFFYHLHKKHNTPYVAIIFFGTLASVIVVASLGSLSFLAYLYNFGAMLAFFATHISLILHRIRFPDMERPFRVHFNIPLGRGRSIPITAVIGALATLTFWTLNCINKPVGRYAGGAWMVFGLIMYFAHRRKYRISPIGSIQIEKIDISDYKALKIEKILLPTKGSLATDAIVVGCSLAKHFGAELWVIHIIELVPFLPSEQKKLEEREQYSELVLKRAQAIALEQGVSIHIQRIHSRSVVEEILNKIEKEKFDLLILGSHNPSSLGPITEKIMQQAKCRVWICRSNPQEMGQKFTR